MLVQFGGNWITQITDVILGYWALSAIAAGSHWVIGGVGVAAAELSYVLLGPPPLLRQNSHCYTT